MPEWFTGHEVEAASTLIALFALGIAIHAEIKLWRINSMNFPGVRAEWEAFYKKHDIIRSRDGQNSSPPCPMPIAKASISIIDRQDEFRIAGFKLRLVDRSIWPSNICLFETYGDPPKAWERHANRLSLRMTDRKSESVAYIDASNVAGPPQFLRVKVERVGGTQSYCWQHVEIETPAEN